MPSKNSAIHAAAAAAALTAGASAVQLRGHASFDAALGMRPDVAAKALLRVEDEWVSQVMTFAECNATLPADQMDEEGIDCARSPKEAFEKSCNTIAFTVVKASSGDRAAATEYMGDVCKQAALDGWRRTYCQSISELVTNTMTADAYENRENFDSRSACTSFWSYLASSEHARAEEEAQKRKMEEEAQEKAAEEAAAAAAAEHQKEQEEAAAQEAAEEAKQPPQGPGAGEGPNGKTTDTMSQENQPPPSGGETTMTSGEGNQLPPQGPSGAEETTSMEQAPAEEPGLIANATNATAVMVAAPAAIDAAAPAEANTTLASTNATAAAPNATNATVVASNATVAAPNATNATVVATNATVVATNATVAATNVTNATAM